MLNPTVAATAGFVDILDPPGLRAAWNWQACSTVAFSNKPERICEQTGPDQTPEGGTYIQRSSLTQCGEDSTRASRVIDVRRCTKPSGALPIETEYPDHALRSVTQLDQSGRQPFETDLVFGFAIVYHVEFLSFLHEGLPRTLLKTA